MPELQNKTAPASRPNTTLTVYTNTITGDNAQTLAWSSPARPKDLPIPEYSQQNRRNLSLSEILNGPDTLLGAGQTFYNATDTRQENHRYIFFSSWLRHWFREEVSFYLCQLV